MTPPTLRALGAGPVGVSPVQHREDDGPQVAARVGEPVLVTLPVPGLAIGDADDDALSDEAGEPAGEHVACDAQVCGEVVEPADAVEQVAQHQHRPPVADDGRGPGHRPPIATTLGFGVEEVEEGRVVFTMEPAEFHFNPIGSVHGGVFATLLDSAAGCAVHSALPAGARYTSPDLSVKFLRGLGAGSGPVRCEGLVIHMGSRTALAEARLFDGAGRLCAHATSSCLIFRPGTR